MLTPLCHAISKDLELLALVGFSLNLVRLSIHLILLLRDRGI